MSVTLCAGTGTCNRGEFRGIDLDVVFCEFRDSVWDKAAFSARMVGVLRRQLNDFGMRLFQSFQRFKPITSVTCCVGILALLVNPSVVDGQVSGNLTVKVLEGDGEFVDINQCCLARQITVEVIDPQGKPLPDAQVMFSLPSRGPSGYFPGNIYAVFLTTDAEGKASATGLRHNGVRGQFAVRISASYGEIRGAAFATQNNSDFGSSVQFGQEFISIRPGDGSEESQGSSKKWLLIGAIAGGAVAALFVSGTIGGSSKKASMVGISVGKPRIDPPQ